MCEMFLKAGNALCQLGNEGSQRGDSNRWGKTPRMLIISMMGSPL